MPTDSHNDRYPITTPYGEDGYGGELDRVLDSLWTDVPGVGSVAERPSATDRGAPEAWISNEPAVYRNTGTSWQAASGGGGTTAVNAADYGGATADRQIQNAIDALPAEGGEVIVPSAGPDTMPSASALFAAGSPGWIIHDMVVAPSNVRLRGDSTQLRLADGAACPLIATNSDVGDPKTEHVRITGFRMDGNVANNTAASGRWTSPSGATFSPGCVHAIDSRDVWVADCEFAHNRGYGVRFMRSQNSGALRCESHHMGDDGFTATDAHCATATTSDIRFISCHAHDNHNSGFEVDDGPHRVHLVDCLSEGNGANGYQTKAHAADVAPRVPRNIHHIRCDAVDNANRGFVLGPFVVGASSGHYYRDCTATGTGQAQILVGIANNTNESRINNVVIDSPTIEAPAGAGDPAIHLDPHVGVGNITISGGTIDSEASAARIGATGSDIEGLTVEGVAFGGGGAGDDVALGGGVADARLDELRPRGGVTVSDSGTRTLRNGVGTNNGDPSSAGEWSGHGVEGVVVYDTSGSRPFGAHRFINGSWQSA